MSKTGGCSSCGSPIVYEIALSEGIIAVKVGTLDDTSDIVPTVEAWCVDRQPWVRLPEVPIVLQRE